MIINETIDASISWSVAIYKKSEKNELKNNFNVHFVAIRPKFLKKKP